jgi:3-methyladenine DNA glycosylase AlkD
MDQKRSVRYHLELMSEVKAHARPLTQSQKEKMENYIGTAKTCYAIGASTERQTVRNWINKHPDLEASEFVDLLNSLCLGESCNEISLAGELLESLPKLRNNIEPGCLDIWLNKVQGWGEVDSICQSKFSAKEVLARWGRWKSLLTKLAIDDNVHKRRASLVLLTKPVRDSGETRLADLAFANIDRLKQDREILVTKAVSWLLRGLIKNHRERVEKYLRENEDRLPRLAVRETRTKLLTGRKTPARKKMTS